MSEALDKIIDEARKELGAREAERVDWGALEAGLFARIDRERRERRSGISLGRVGVWARVGAGLAAAAVIALVALRHRAPASSTIRSTTSESSATALVVASGGAQLLINGRAVSSRAAVRLGDTVEAGGTRVAMLRPEKVSLILEPGAKATVTGVEAPLVLALARGAIEAQVTHVPSGQAFAVDVDGARVAVHGTHLRVARQGDHVTVDLSTGVISIGRAPGDSTDATFTAPAHVEFDASDVRTTIVATRDPAAVRPPEVLRSSSAAPESAAPRPAILDRSAPSSTGITRHAHGEARGMPSSAPKAEPMVPEQAADSATPPEANAGAEITKAVEECMARRPRADNVIVNVRTILRLDLNEDGSVRAARFDPPVAPDVNACASQSIYAARFSCGGSITIPVDFTN
ncbi:MAG: FecR domain-containing protein [Polyangiaceae bacterium]